MKTTKFKPSEVGPVPVDWEVRKLGELFDFKNGYNADAKNYGRGTPVASVLDALAERPFKASSIRARVSAPPRDRESFSLKRGDLIFTRSSETLEDVGRSNVYDDEAVAMFGGFVIRGRPKTDNNSTFINLLLKTRGHRDRVMSQGAGAQHYNIGQSGLERVLVSLPPLPEQKAVAEALSDVDALLAAMTKLIEKKRAIKQGAMQQLLTGKKRLAGFTGKWVEKRLGDCGYWIGGGTPSTRISQYWNGSIPWISSSDIVEGDVRKVQYSRFITQEAVKNSATAICPIGTIHIVARVGVGKIAVATRDTCTSQDYTNLVLEKNDVWFFAYLVSRTMMALKEETQGTSIKGLSLEDLKKIVIKVPPFLAEQKAIAAVLTDMDAEIMALEAKLSKYESIKQGMMQELLTGKTRLSV